MPSRHEPSASRSRAAVVRGTAWSEPAVAVIAAAPLAAASPLRYSVDFAAGVARSIGGGTPFAVSVSGATGTRTAAESGLTVTGAQTVTIDFRRDVTDAEFTLAGFDWVQDGDERGVKDTVTVTPAPTGTVPAGVTPGNPFTAASEGTGRSVVVAIAGPVSGLTLQLSNPVGPDAPA